jgi:hypothetical protein
VFRSITIENFRCFRKLELKSLDRVNLIAGMNDTGKTSVLEAIRLHCKPTDCAVALTLANARGISDPSKEFPDCCGWLFHDKDPSAAVRVRTEDDGAIGRLTTLELLEPASAGGDSLSAVEKLIRERLAPGTGDGNLPRLVLKYQDTTGQEALSVGVAGRGFTSILGVIGWKPRCRFLKFGGYEAGWDVRLFSDVEAAKRQDDLLPTLRILEPRVKRLALLAPVGAPAIHADVGLSRLIPVAFMGEGFNRILSIMLAIAGAEGGYVLIDEVENGLHHSVMEKVWQAIADAAARADAQVFATTHSYECIQAAHRAFAARQPYDFRLHRLQRVRDEIQAVTYDQRSLGTSLEMSFEVR